MMQAKEPSKQESKPVVTPPPRGYFDGKIPVVIIKKKK